MSLHTQGYFNALRSYLKTDHYEVKEPDGGCIVMKEKVSVAGSPKPVEYRVRLGVTGEELVINLHKKNRKGNSDQLSHFLNDNAKPWSKRCDFIIFPRVRWINVDCFEFRSTTFPDARVDGWNRGKRGAELCVARSNPTPAMRSRRHIFTLLENTSSTITQDIEGLSLDALDNASIECIN